MGFMDSAKSLFAKGKDAVGEHADKIEDGIEKVADTIDDKTGGKYSDQIDTAAEKAQDFIEGLDND